MADVDPPSEAGLTARRGFDFIWFGLVDMFFVIVGGGQFSAP